MRISRARLAGGSAPVDGECADIHLRGAQSGRTVHLEVLLATPPCAPVPGTASQWIAVPTGAHVSLLESPPVRSPTLDLDVLASTLDLDVLEDAFAAWAHDPAKPDAVDLGAHGAVSMVELLRRVRGSTATLSASASSQIGSPPGVTIAAAAARLLHATVDPDGPQCRSFRAASYYLCGLARLDADLRPDPAEPGVRTDGSGGDLDVR